MYEKFYRKSRLRKADDVFIAVTFKISVVLLLNMTNDYSHKHRLTTTKKQVEKSLTQFFDGTEKFEKLTVNSFR